MKKLNLMFNKSNKEKDNKRNNEQERLATNVTEVNFKRNIDSINRENVENYLCKKLKSKRAYLNWYSDESLKLFEIACEDNIKLTRVQPHYSSYEVLEELVKNGGEKYELGLYYALVSSDLEKSIVTCSVKDIAKTKYYKPIGYALNRGEINKLTDNYMKPDKGVDLFLSKKPLLSIQLSDGYSIDYYGEEKVFIESRRKIYSNLLNLVRKSPRGITNVLIALLLTLSNNNITKKKKLNHLKMTPETFAQKYYEEYVNRNIKKDDPSFTSKILDKYVTEVPLILLCNDIESVLNTLNKNKTIELHEASAKDVAERYGLVEYFKNEEISDEVASKVMLDIAERIVCSKIPTKEDCYKLVNRYNKQRDKTL